MIEKSQKNKPQRWDVCSFRVIIWFLRVVCRRPRALTQRHSFYIFPLDGRGDGRESPQEDKGDRKNNKWENGFSQSYLGENKFGSSFSICMYISKHVGSFPFFSPVRSVRRDPEMIWFTPQFLWRSSRAIHTHKSTKIETNTAAG
jgi:hypothetical protein